MRAPPLLNTRAPQPRSCRRRPSRPAAQMFDIASGRLLRTLGGAHFDTVNCCRRVAACDPCPGLTPRSCCALGPLLPLSAATILRATRAPRFNATWSGHWCSRASRSFSAMRGGPSMHVCAWRPCPAAPQVERRLPGAVQRQQRLQHCGVGARSRAGGRRARALATGQRRRRVERLTRQRPLGQGPQAGGVD